MFDPQLLPEFIAEIKKLNENLSKINKFIEEFGKAIKDMAGKK